MLKDAYGDLFVTPISRYCTQSETLILSSPSTKTKYSIQIDNGIDFSSDDNSPSQNPSLPINASFEPLTAPSDSTRALPSRLTVPSLAAQMTRSLFLFSINQWMHLKAYLEKLPALHLLCDQVYTWFQMSLKLSIEISTQLMPLVCLLYSRDLLLPHPPEIWPDVSLTVYLTADEPLTTVVTEAYLFGTQHSWLKCHLTLTCSPPNKFFASNIFIVSEVGCSTDKNSRVLASGIHCSNWYGRHLGIPYNHNTAVVTVINHIKTKLPNVKKLLCI